MCTSKLTILVSLKKIEKFVLRKEIEVLVFYFSEDGSYIETGMDPA